MQMMLTSPARIGNGSDISSTLVPEFLKICEWLRSNKLSINTLKNKSIKTKSLVLVIDEFLTWDKYIEYIANKIKQNLGMMKKSKDVSQKIHW